MGAPCQKRALHLYVTCSFFLFIFLNQETAFQNNIIQQGADFRLNKHNSFWGSSHVLKKIWHWRTQKGLWSPMAVTNSVDLGRAHSPAPAKEDCKSYAQHNLYSIVIVILLISRKSCCLSCQLAIGVNGGGSSLSLSPLRLKGKFTKIHKTLKTHLEIHIHTIASK